jgi:hypothetical protein
MKTLIQTCILALALSANAQGYVECLAEYNSPTAGSDDGTIGFAFKANQDLTVMELGVFANIFETVGPIEVKVWDDAGDVKASAIVTATSPQFNLTRYEILATPLSLLAQQVYFIGAYLPQLVGVNYVGPDFGGSCQVFSGVQYLGYATNSAAAKPFLVPGGEAIIPGAANFRIVPEPALTSILALGAAAFLLARRARKA